MFDQQIARQRREQCDEYFAVEQCDEYFGSSLHSHHFTLKKKNQTALPIWKLMLFEFLRQKYAFQMIASKYLTVFACQWYFDHTLNR